MRFSKILLIKPFYHSSHYNNRFLPTGLAYVSEALIKANIENKVFDLGLGYKLCDLKKEIDGFQPQLIGISMMSFAYKYTYEMIDFIKKSYPHISVVVGGPHLSTLREKVLEECQAIDFGITLEGEETIVELCCENKLLSEIKGLMFRDSYEKIIYNGDREFIGDLDKNGFPYCSKVQMDKYPLSINVLTSRGCPYQCIYCPVHLTIGKKFRIRSHKSVVDEFRYWYEKGYRAFGIVDDNFSLVRKRVLDICKEIEKQGLTGLELSCGNGLRADKVDRELLARMKEVGFNSIAFGVEGGNDKVLEALNKSEKIETVDKAIKDACDLDYMVTLFFLLGSPGETKADIGDSLRLATKYPVYDVRFYNLIPFQNTKLFEWVMNKKYLRKDPMQFIGGASHWVNDPIFETPELSIKDRRKLLKLTNKKVQRHTFPVKRRFNMDATINRFVNTGMPKWIALYLSWIYWTYPFYVIFRKTGIIDLLPSNTGIVAWVMKFFRKKNYP